MKRTALLEEAVRLDVEDRIELVEAIWDTLASNPDAIPLPPDHQAELDRRLDAEGPVSDAGSTWEHVRSRLERRGR